MSSAARTSESSVSAALKICSVVALLGYVWVQAHAIVQKPADTSPNTFPAPQTFVATPPRDLPSVNVRGGPGLNFPIKENLPRGARVIGVARAYAADGKTWIVLAADRGYVRESILTPESGAGVSQ